MSKEKPQDGQLPLQAMRVVEKTRKLAVDTKEAADMLSCTDRYVRDMCRKGILKGFRLGRKNWRVPVAEMERYMRSQQLGVVEIKRTRDGAGRYRAASDTPLLG